MATVLFKRGDTFDQLLLIPEATFEDGYFLGWTVTSQLRRQTAGNPLIADLVTSWADVAAETRFLRLTNTNTTGWPIGVQELDVQFEDTDGFVQSTETILVDVIKDVTRAV